MVMKTDGHKVSMLVYLASHLTKLKDFFSVLGKNAEDKKLRMFNYVDEVLKTCPFCFFSSSQLSTSIPHSGPIRTSLTFLEARLGLISNRLSYQPIGTHLSPRSVLE